MRFAMLPLITMMSKRNMLIPTKLNDNGADFLRTRVRDREPRSWRLAASSRRDPSFVRANHFAHDLTPWTGAARAHLLCRFRIQVSKPRGLNFSHSSLIRNSAKRFFQSSTTCTPSCVPRSETPWLCSNFCASSTAGCCRLPASFSTRSPVCDCAPHAPSWRCSRRALDFQFRDRYRVLLSWR